METRQLIVALLIAFGVYLVYAQLYARFAPRPAPPPAQQATDSAGAPTSRGTAGTAGAPGSTTAPATAAASGPALSLTRGNSLEPITLGGGPDDRLQVVLSPLGAAIETLDLTERRSNGRYTYRLSADSQAPARVLSPIRDETRQYGSFLTARLQITERPNESWRLDDLVWSVADRTPSRVSFRTQLATPDGSPLLRIEKRFDLVTGMPLMLLDLEFSNLSPQPLTVTFVQDGPLGILREHLQADMRRVMAATGGGGKLVAGGAYTWTQLRDAVGAGEPVRLIKPAPGQNILWTALGEKFFAVYTRPVSGGPADFGGAPWVASVSGIVHTVNAVEHGSDLVARFQSQPQALPAGGGGRYQFEIYAGPKDSDVLRRVNPAFADGAQLGYHVFHGADLRCWCSPLWLTDLMTWILQGLITVLRNGGLAIVGIVLIVRTLLHPLAVFQQKSMYKLQEGMSRIQPKIDEIREKHAGDQVKINQETMKLYGAEGVNPASGLVGMVPLIIQLPILGALWTALSTDIYLRHAPLDGWWIRDLSSPDALIPFNPPLPTPWLSFLGLSAIPAFNLLPILMGISMWLQQKYMPKPAMHAKLEAARAAGPQPRRPGGGMTAEEQLRQQQFMANTMSIMMPIMFYAMPAGLNLYWMATNVYGIIESLIIRKQIAREKERRAAGAPEPVRKPGWMAGWMKRLAEQAEDLQRKADELSRENKRRDADKKKR